jgi:hypothetical protein
MNNKRLFNASVAVFVVLFVLEWLIHGVLLAGIYKETAIVWRPMADEQKLMWLMWLGYLIFAPFFVTIFDKGYERDKPAHEQGMRFGLLVGLAFAPMQALVWYTVLPIPSTLAFYWLVAGIVEFVVLGLTVGWVYGWTPARRATSHRRVTRARHASRTPRPKRRR